MSATGFVLGFISAAIVVVAGVAVGFDAALFASAAWLMGLTVGRESMR